MIREDILKHRDVFNKWLDGAEIQYYDGKEWINIENPDWDKNFKYRVKPKIELKDCHFNEKEYCTNEYNGIIEIYTKNHKIQHKKGFIKDKEIAEAYSVLPQLIRLRDEYNEGWKPDWEIEYVKYYIRVYKNKWHLDYHSSAHCLLAFKTEETRDRFFEDHRDLIEIAKPFL